MKPRLVSEAQRIFLPSYLDRSDELCMLHHDVLVEMLRWGEEQDVFAQVFDFRDAADRLAFDRSADVVEWLERTRDPNEWASFIRRSVFPALLADFLHFLHEALRASRLAKLTVAYALLRKPLQDNLGLIEAIAVDPQGFVETFAADPLRLRPMKAGGVDAHTARVGKVLSLLREGDRFDAGYLARLRYQKAGEDGFDGSCNQALHLFTEHDAIRTERLNINFIFSDDDARRTQWYFPYSRLPYVLHYARLLFEHLLASFSRTDPEYLADIERRTGAATLLWWPALLSSYRSAELERYVGATERRVWQACQAAGARRPSPHDLLRMRETGAFPGESVFVTHRRSLSYRLRGYSTAALHGATRIARRIRTRLGERRRRGAG